MFKTLISDVKRGGWYEIQWRLEFCGIVAVAAGFGFCNGCLLAACYLNGLEFEALKASIGQ